MSIEANLPQLQLHTGFGPSMQPCEAPEPKEVAQLLGFLTWTLWDDSVRCFRPLSFRAACYATE